MPRPNYTLEECFNFGKMDALSGVETIFDCPFRAGSKRAEQWYKGYAAMRAVMNTTPTTPEPPRYNLTPRKQ